MITCRQFITCLCIAVFLAVPVGNAATANEGLATVLTHDADPAWGGRVSAAWPEVRAFYADRQHRPLWFEGKRITDRGRAVLASLARAHDDGLDPAHFESAVLLDAINRTTQTVDVFEVRLTGQLLHFVGELRHGRFVDLNIAEKDTFRGTAAMNISAVLSLFDQTDDVAAAFRQVTPGNVYYRALRRELGRLRGQAAAVGGWPVVGSGQTLKLGMVDERVPQVRARLMASDTLFADLKKLTDTVYDDVTAESVRLFQKNHGLEPDAVIGKNTLAEMNVPIDLRIDQIMLNMERWRWMPDDLGERFIVVNLAGFDLSVFDGGSSVLTMPVIVGRPFRRTPVFSGAMSYLELNPTWTLPPTILKEDILPKLRTDPGYLATKGIDVYDGWGAQSKRLDSSQIDWNAGQARLMGYRYVQPPGPKNALGNVKFMFPNPYSIYLHDTPDRGLFKRAERAASSGCIRVANPAELAAFLLQDQPEWTLDVINAAFTNENAKTPTRVNLTTRVPVHMTYSTAWVGEGGTMQFRADVYGRDADLRQSLAAIEQEHHSQSGSPTWP